MSTLYQSKDGEIFSSKKEAQDHDTKLFGEWLRSNPAVSALEFSEFINKTTLDLDILEEHKRGSFYLRLFWEDNF